jgi:hypothetical protein
MSNILTTKASKTCYFESLAFFLIFSCLAVSKPMAADGFGSKNMISNFCGFRFGSFPGKSCFPVSPVTIGHIIGCPAPAN